MSEPRSVHLFYREGGSDKVYNAHLAERADGWAVTFEFGRRGKPLKAGEKGAGLDFPKASAIFDKLVAEKTGKGYTPEESGIAFSSAEMAGRDTGIRPKLLNEISREEAMDLGDEWLMQEKHDGERRILIGDAGGVRFANRKGLETGVQAPVAEAFTRLHGAIGGDLVLDGEDMGDHVVIFDVMRHFMIREGTMRERAAILGHVEKTIANMGDGAVLRVDIPSSARDFLRDALPRLEKGGAEGFVAIHAESRYTAGRPASGGTSLKVKFWDDITCRVSAGRDGKRSVGIELLDGDGAWQPVGNVTIPANAAVPEPGQMIDVKYLYAHRGGSLFQPAFRGLREDVDPGECRMDRLKYAREAQAPENDGPGL